jgi:hypothetical protein
MYYNSTWLGKYTPTHQDHLYYSHGTATQHTHTLPSSHHRLPITVLHIAYALPVVQVAPSHSRPGLAALVPSFVGLFVSSTPNATLAVPLPRSCGSTLGSSPNRLITTSSSLSALLAALSGTVLSADLAALACVVRLALLLALARFGDG